MHYALEFLRLQQQQRRQQDAAQLEHWLMSLLLGATSQALEAAARLSADRAAAAASEAARVAILTCIQLDRRQVLFDQVGGRIALAGGGSPGLRRPPGKACVSRGCSAGLRRCSSLRTCSLFAASCAPWLTCYRPTHWAQAAAAPRPATGRADLPPATHTRTRALTSSPPPRRCSPPSRPRASWARCWRPWSRTSWRTTLRRWPPR
jgi:hypothetical protein